MNLGPINNQNMQSSPIRNSQITGNVVKKYALELFKPANLIIFITFILPLLEVISVVGMSFVFQNFKGLIYLGFLLGVLFLRELMFANSDKYEKSSSDGTICTAIQFSNIGNSTFSVFVTGFTFMYLCLPMFINSSVNWAIFSLFVFLLFLDVGVKILKGCIKSKNYVQLFIDFLMSFTLSSIIVSAMYAGGSGKYLFFNETSSDKEVCTTPKKQTFKCAVYKNGELIG